MRRSILMLVPILFTAAVFAPCVGASDRSAVFAIVDKVVLEPNDENPERIQIWGTFALIDKEKGDFGDPQSGYLYYQAKAGGEDASRREWLDLKRIAGTRQFVSFGRASKLKAVGSVRKSSEKVEKPADYPLNIGLFRIHEDADFPLAHNLRTFPAVKSPKENEMLASPAVTLAVTHRADRKGELRYEFELDDGAGHKELATVKPRDAETSWTPDMKLQPGGKYTWRVRAVREGWAGPYLTCQFQLAAR